MAELSKLAQATIELTGAWDERKRTFDRLRDLKLSDEDRQKALADYTEASAHFEKLRSAVVKK